MNHVFASTRNFFRFRSSLVLALLVSLIGAGQLHGQAFRSVQSGDWNQQTTWARTAALAGTVTSNVGTPNVTGAGTTFTTDVAVGDQLYDNTFALIGTVLTVTDDNNLVLDANAAITVAGVAYFVGNSYPTAAGATALINNHTVNLTTTESIFGLTINNNAAADLNLNTAAVTLTLGGGGLTVLGAGDIVGAGAGAAVVLNGGGVTFNAGAVTLSTALPIRFTAAGTVTATTAASVETIESNNVLVNVAGAATLSIRDQFANAGGTPTLRNDGLINFLSATPIGGAVTLDFFTNANTVEFSSAGSFTLPALNYRSLTLSGGAKDLATGTSIVTTTLTLNAALNVGANTLNLGNNGAAPNGPGTIAGTVTNLVTVAGSSLEMRGTAAQTIPTSVTALTNLTINNSAGSPAVTLAVGLGTLTVSGTYTMTAGNVQIGANTLVVTGNYARTAGAFVSNVASNFTFNSAGTWTGNFQSQGAFNFGTLVINSTGAAVPALGTALNINTQLNLQAGELNLNGQNLSIVGTASCIRTAGAFRGSATSGLIFSTSTSPAQPIVFATTLVLERLNINNAAITVPLGSNLTVSGTAAGEGLLMNNGSLDLNGFDLVASGIYARTGANFIGDVASDLTFSGATAIVNQTIPFVTDLNLASLTINNANANAIQLGSALIPAALNLTAGNLGLNAFNLDVAGVYTRGTGNFVGNAASNLTFSGTGALAGQTLSFVTPRVVNDLTISNSTAQTFSLASWLEVDNTLNLSGATQLDIAAQRLTLSGNPIAGTVTNLLGGATSDLVITGAVAGHTVPSHLTALNTLIITNTDAGGVGYVGPSTLVVDSLVVGTAPGFFAPSAGVDMTVSQDITVTSGDIRLSGTSQLTHLGTSTISPGVTAFNNTGTSTVFYNGAGAQDVLNGQYANLTLNNNPKTFVSALVPNRLFLVSLNFTPGTGVHTLNGAAIVMNGAAPQTLGDLNSTHPAGGYGRLRIANTGGGVNLTQSTTVGDSLDLVSGTFTVDAGQTLTINGITLAAPTVGRTGNLVGSATSTVIYDRVAAGQPVIRADYANLEFQGGSKVLDNGGNIEVSEVFTPGILGTHTTTGSTFVFDGTAAQTLPRFNWTGALGTGYNNVNITNNSVAGVTTGTLAPGVLVSGVLDVAAGSTLTITNTETAPLSLAGSYGAGTGTLQGSGDDSGVRILGGALAPALTLPAIGGLGYLEVYHTRVAAVALGGAVTVSSPRGVGAATDAALRLRSGALNNTAFNVTLPADALILATGGTLTANPTFGATRCDLFYTNTAAGAGPLLPAGPVSFESGFEIPAGGTLIGANSSVVATMAAAGNTVFLTSNLTVPAGGTFTLNAGTFAMHDQAVATTYALNIQGNYVRTGGTFQGTVIGVAGSDLSIGSSGASTVTGTLNFSGAAPNLFTLNTNHAGVLPIATALNVRSAVNVNGGTLQQTAGVVIRGNLNIADGATFAINGQTLTMGEATFASGTITAGTSLGQLTGSATSNLIFLGTGAGAVPNMPAALDLADLTITRTGGADVPLTAGATVTLNETVNINDDITISAGTLNNGQNLTIQWVAPTVTTLITMTNTGADLGFMRGAGGTFGTGEPNWNSAMVDLTYLYTVAFPSTNYDMSVECPDSARNALRTLVLNLFDAGQTLAASKRIKIGSRVAGRAAPADIGPSQLNLVSGIYDCNGFDPFAVIFPRQNTTNPLLLRTPNGSISCAANFEDNVNLFYSGAVTNTGPEVPSGSPGLVNNLTVLLDAPGQVLNWNAGSNVEITTSVQLLRGVLNLNNAFTSLRFGSESPCNPASHFYFYKTPDAALTDNSLNGEYQYSQCNEYTVRYIEQSEVAPVAAPDFTVDAGFEVRYLTATGKRSVTNFCVQAATAGASTGNLTVDVQQVGVNDTIQVSDSLQLDNTGAFLGIVNVTAGRTLEIQNAIGGVTAPIATSIGDITSVPTGTTLYSAGAAGQVVLGKATGIAAPTTFYGNLTWTGGTKTVGAVTIPYSGTLTPNAGPHDFAVAGANGTLFGTSVMVNGTAAQTIPPISTDVPNGGAYFNLHLNRAAATAQASLGGTVIVGDSNAVTVATAGQLILNMTGAGFDTLAVGAQQFRVGASVTRTAGAIGTGASLAGTVWYQSDLPAGGTQQLLPRGEYANLRLNNQTKTFDAAGTIRLVSTFEPGAAATAHTTTGNIFEYGGTTTITLRGLPAGGGYGNLTIANPTDPAGPTDAAIIRTGENIIVGEAFTMTSAAATPAFRAMAVDGRVNLNGQRLTLNGAIDFGDRGRFVGGTTSELFIGAGAIGANTLRFVEAAPADYTLQTLSLTRVGAASSLTLGSRLLISGNTGTTGLISSGTNPAGNLIFSGQILEINGSYQMSTAGGENFNLLGSTTSQLFVQPVAGSTLGALVFEDGNNIGSLTVNANALGDDINIRTRTQGATTDLTIGSNTSATETFTLTQGDLLMTNRWVIQCGMTFGANGRLSGNTTNAALTLTGASAANGARLVSGTLNFDPTTPGTTDAVLAYVQSNNIANAISLGSTLTVGANTAASLFTMTSGVLSLNGQSLTVNAIYTMTNGAGFRGSATSQLSFTGTQTPAAAPDRLFRWVESSAAALPAEFRLQSLTLNNANLDLDLDQAGSTATNRKLVLGDSTAALATCLTFTNGNLDVTDGDTLVIGGQITGTVGTLNSGAGGTGLVGIDAGTVRYTNINPAQQIRSTQYGFLTFNNVSKTFNTGTLSIAGAGSVGAFTPGTATHVLNAAATTIQYNGNAQQVIRHNFVTDVPNGGSYRNLTLASTAGGATLAAASGLRLTVGNHGAHSATNVGVFVMNLTGAGNTFTLQADTLVINNTWTQTAGTLTVTNTGAIAGQGVVNFNQQAFPFATQTLPAASFNYGTLIFSQYPKTLGAFTHGIGGAFITDTDTVNSISSTGYAHTTTGSTVNFNGDVAQTVPSFNVGQGFTGGYNNLTFSNSLVATSLTLTGTVRVAAAFSMDPMPSGSSVRLNSQRIVFNGTVNHGGGTEAFIGGNQAEMYYTGGGALTNGLEFITTNDTSYRLRSFIYRRNDDFTMGTRMTIVGTGVNQGYDFSPPGGSCQHVTNQQRLELRGRIRMAGAGVTGTIRGNTGSDLIIENNVPGLVNNVNIRIDEDIAANSNIFETLRVNLGQAADSIRFLMVSNAAGTNNSLIAGNNATAAAGDTCSLLRGTVLLNGMLQPFRIGTSPTFTDSFRFAGLRTSGTLNIDGTVGVTGSTGNLRFAPGRQLAQAFLLNASAAATTIRMGTNLHVGNDAATQYRIQQGTLDLNGNQVTINGGYQMDANGSFVGSATSGLIFQGTAATAAAPNNALRFSGGRRLDTLTLNNSAALFDLDLAGTAIATPLVLGDSTAALTPALTLTDGNLDIPDGQRLVIGGQASIVAANASFNGLLGGTTLAGIDDGSVQYSNVNAGQNVLISQYGFLQLTNAAKTFANGVYSVANTSGIGAFAPGAFTHTLDQTAGAGTRIRYNGTAAAQVVRHNFATNVNAGGSYFGLELVSATAGTWTLGGSVVVGDSTNGTGGYVLNLSGVGAALGLGANRLTLSGPIANTAGTYTGGATSQLVIRGPAGAGAVPTFSFTAGSQELNLLRMARPTRTFTLGSNLRVGSAAGGGNLILATTTTLAVDANTLTIGDLTSDDVTPTGGTWNGGALTSAATGTVSYDRGAANQRLIPAAYGNLTLSNFTKIFRNGGTPAGEYGIANAFTPSAAQHNVTTNAPITINYNGTVAQTIANLNTDLDALAPGDYPSLTLSNTGPKTFFSADMRVFNTFVMNVTGATPTVSLAATRTVLFGGPMTYVSGTITGTTTSSLNIQGTGTITNATGWPFTVGSQVLQNFTINRNGETFLLGSNLAMQGTGTTSLDDGVLSIGANNLLTISGIFTQGTGTLSGSGTSDLTIDGNTVALPSPVTFTAGARQLRNLTFSRIGSPNVFTFNTDLTVGGTAGTGTLSIGGGSEVSINGQNLILTGGITNAGTFRGGASSTLTVGGFAGSIALNIPTVTDDIQNLVIDNTRPVDPPTASLAAPLTVLNQLSLTNGVVGTTTTNVLTVGATAATGTVSPSGGSPTSYVHGPVRKFLDANDSFIYPVGREGRWRRAEITAAASSPAGRPFTVDLLVGSPISFGRDGDLTSPTEFNVSKLEHHSVESPTVGPATVLGRVRLYWGLSSVVSTTPADWDKLFLAQWNGAAWDSTLAGGRGSANATNNPSFDPSFGFVTSQPALNQTMSTRFFSIASVDQTNPLPVTWLTVVGRWEDGVSARIDWSTASELNNDRFELERSFDLQSWSVVGTVPGSGTTQQVRRYTYLDREVPNGGPIVYYRIRQIDLDGQSSLSPVVRLTRDAQRTQKADDFLVYPNPFRAGTLQIIGIGPDLDRQGPFTLRVVNIDGRMVSEKTGDLANVIEITRQALERVDSGIYTLVIESAKGLERHRLVKQ